MLRNNFTYQDKGRPSYIAGVAIASVLTFVVGTTHAADGPPSVDRIEIPAEVLNNPGGGGNPGAGMPSAGIAEQSHQPPEGARPAHARLPMDSVRGVADVSSRIQHQGSVTSAPAPEASATVNPLELAIMQGTRGRGQDVIQGDPGNGITEITPSADTSEIPQESGSVPAEEGRSATVQTSEWDGVDFTQSGWRPPDTVVAVGTKYVVEAVNSGYAVYDKKGNTVQGYISAQTFYSAVAPTSSWTSYFDPRLVYDQDRDQYVMLFIGRETVSQTSYSFLGISKTGDPTGDWYTWRFVNNSGLSGSWMDYQNLGADKWGVYWSGNMFSWGGGFTQTDMYTYDDSYFSGTATGGYKWSNLQWPSGSGGGSAFSLQAAKPHTVNTNGESYFVNTRFSTGNEVLLWTLSGKRAPSDSDFTAAASLAKAATSTGNYYMIGNNVDQSGSTTDIDGGDSRIQNAIYSNRRVWTTWTDAVGNDTTRAGVRTVKLNSDTGVNEWSKTLWGANNYYFYPALTVLGTSTSSPIGLVHNWSSASKYPSAVYKVYNDPDTNNIGAWFNYHSGTGPYVGVFGGRNRFGDYSGAAYDFTCNGRYFGALEYATTSPTTWATRLIGIQRDGTSPCPLGVPSVLARTSPTHNSTTTDTTPSYSWTGDSDAEDYLLYVYNYTDATLAYSTTMSKAAASCSTDTTCVYTPTTALTANKNYGWWVTGVNTYYGQGPWQSSPWRFDVDGATVPGNASSLTPSGGVYVADQTPTLTWTAGSGATWHYLYMQQIGDNTVTQRWVSAASSGCTGGGTCTYTWNTPALYGEVRYWVRAWNVIGFSPAWSSSGKFTTTGDRPYLFKPTGSGAGANPTYTWAPVTGATWYQPYVFHSGTNFLPWMTASSAGCGSTGSGNCSATPANTVSGSAIWWARGWQLGSGSGPWSSGKSFTP